MRDEKVPGVTGTENEPAVARSEAVMDVLDEIRFSEGRRQMANNYFCFSPF